MGTYMIFGKPVSEDSDHFQNMVVDAYHKKHRPLCSCRDPGVAMYIAMLPSGECVVKRMPNSGFQHDKDCDSFEMPSELSGRGALENGAIDDKSGNGETVLKFDFSLSKKKSGKGAPKGDPVENSNAKASESKMSLRALLHYLWEEAGFNRWSPRMEGKRGWCVVKKHLQIAMAHKKAKNEPVANCILIPDAFDATQKQQQVDDRRRFFGSFSGDNSGLKVGICIGEIKQIDVTTNGAKFLIKHMPEVTAFVSAELYKKLNAKFETELAFHNEGEACHLITIFTFVVSLAGNINVESVNLMLVDKNWIPFENVTEFRLLKHLHEQNRYFIKGLRYNLPKSQAIASVLLTDFLPDPKAVFLVSESEEEEQEEYIVKCASESRVPSLVCNMKTSNPYDLLNKA